MTPVAVRRERMKAQGRYGGGAISNNESTSRPTVVDVN
jgi:hypothetical protein